MNGIRLRFVYISGKGLLVPDLLLQLGIALALGFTLFSLGR